MYRKSNFVGGKFFNFDNLYTFHSVMRGPTQKFGLDRFSRFDVYWIQTKRQAKYIYRLDIFIFSGNIRLLLKSK